MIRIGRVDLADRHVVKAWPTAGSGVGLQLIHRHRFLFQRFKPERFYFGFSADRFVKMKYYFI